jgi:hypothetical protein
MSARPPDVIFDRSFFAFSQSELRYAASAWKSTLASPVKVCRPLRESRVHPDFPL